jgi:hypothetical protein
MVMQAEDGVMSKSMMDSIHERAHALASDDVGLRQPLHVLTGEAVDVAGFFSRYYQPLRDPETEVVTRPGLASAGKKRLPANTGKRILALVDEVEAAQKQYLLAADVTDVTQLERARFVVSELTAVLEFLFDDGVEDERDAQLARAREVNEDTSTLLGLASALTDYGNLADHYRDEVDGLGEFDVATIDEAKELATTLRERVAKRSDQAKKKSAAALDWRNRLATVLAQEIGSLRAAARFVFRHHPTIRREAASAYERRVRAARQRAAASTKTPGPAAPTVVEA